MDLGFSYIIPKSEMGFRNYIKHMLSRIETTIRWYEEDRPLNIDPAEYALAKRLSQLHEEFVETLTAYELHIIDLMRFHSKWEKIPDDYYAVQNKMYHKWVQVFFRKKYTIYNELDVKLLGLTLTSIRKYRNISRMAVANATGFTYAQVEHYELGNCMPSTEFLFMFSQIFKCSVDEIFKLSIKKF